ncbi:MAG: porin [Gammaproteobacteria bacterium]|nr:porin [Gammaproteobacteria bacterium]
MKKHLIAAAVAAAVAVPMTASAGDVTLYGTIHMSIDSYDREDSQAGVFGGTASHDEPTAAGEDWLAVNSNNTVFGIKGSEDLGNGLSALFQMEFWMDADGLPGGGPSNVRNTFVGLAGSWGVVGMGRVDTPYKSSTGSLELFSLTPGDYNGIGFEDIRAPDAVFYMSPNWNGFSFQGAVVIPSASAELDGVEATSIAFKYQNGPWFAALAFEDIDDDLNQIGASPFNTWSEDKWRLGLGYTANGLHVGFVYEDRENDDLDVNEDEQSWQISASYTMGNNVFKAAYGEEDIDVAAGGSVDNELFSIGVDHKLSKRTKVYAQYADYDAGAADSDMDAFSVGIVHKF